VPRLSRGVVATLAAALTYLFWFEYLPPFNRIHLHSDIEGYHWPLLVAAHEAIRHGRFPLWDSSIYCGIPFSGNIQAALFYPPVWLLFAANFARAQRPGIWTRRFAGVVMVMVVIQLLAGMANLLLHAPIWLQILHLLLSDLIWIALVLLTATSSAQQPHKEAVAAVEAPAAA